MRSQSIRSWTEWRHHYHHFIFSDFKSRHRAIPVAGKLALNRLSCLEAVHIATLGRCLVFVRTLFELNRTQPCYKFQSTLHPYRILHNLYFKDSWAGRLLQHRWCSRKYQKILAEKKSGGTLKWSISCLKGSSENENIGI